MNKDLSKDIRYTDSSKPDVGMGGARSVGGQNQEKRTRKAQRILPHERGQDVLSGLRLICRSFIKSASNSSCRVSKRIHLPSRYGVAAS